jgi:hypothetical protein
MLPTSLARTLSWRGHERPARRGYNMSMSQRSPPFRIGPNVWVVAPPARPLIIGPDVVEYNVNAGNNDQQKECSSNVVPITLTARPNQSRSEGGEIPNKTE